MRRKKQSVVQKIELIGNNPGSPIMEFQNEERMLACLKGWHS